MWKKKDIERELQEIAPALIGIQNENVYTVQASYFLELPVKVLQKIKATETEEESEFFNFTSGEKNSFTTPAGYFEGFPGQVMAKIRAINKHENEIQEELSLIAPTLAGLSKHEVYTVPQGYFEGLKPIIEKPSAKVVSMYSVRRAFRYVAAAVVIAITAFSAYLFLDKSPAYTDGSAEVAKTLINIDAAVETLSEAEIVEFLQTNAAYADGSMSNYYVPDNDTDFEKVIDNLSEEDLQEFLKQYPEQSKKQPGNS